MRSQTGQMRSGGRIANGLLLSLTTMLVLAGAGCQSTNTGAAGDLENQARPLEPEDRFPSSGEYRGYPNLPQHEGLLIKP